MKKLISVTTRLFAVMVVLLSSLSFAHAHEKNLATTLENRDIPRYVEQKNRMLQGNVDILWVGDSITHFWETSGKAVWDKFYGKRNAMNFAISGDRTGHVLWRIENSPMDKISPKLIILMIGTNNIGHKKPNSQEMHSTPSETVEGIETIVKKLKETYPQAQLLLLDVFPRGNKPDDPFRIAVNDINAGLRKIYLDNKVENVKMYEIGNLFLDENGILSPEIMPDFLHPNQKGYEIWANAIEPVIVDVLGEGNQN